MSVIVVLFYLSVGDIVLILGIESKCLVHKGKGGNPDNIRSALATGEEAEHCSLIISRPTQSRESKKEKKAKREREIIKRKNWRKKKGFVCVKEREREDAEWEPEQPVGGAEFGEPELQQPFVEGRRRDVKVCSLHLQSQGGRDWKEEDGGQRKGSASAWSCRRRN